MPQKLAKAPEKFDCFKMVIVLFHFRNQSINPSLFISKGCCRKPMEVQIQFLNIFMENVASNLLVRLEVGSSNAIVIVRPEVRSHSVHFWIKI
jgi:hypothetical protein